MSRIRRMRRGDREALRELLREQGAALEALAAALGEPRLGIAALARGIWAATVVPGPEDERPFALGAALATWAEALPEPVAMAVVEVTPADLAQQVARVELGWGDALDAELLESTLRAHPEARALADRFRVALRAGRAAPSGPSARGDAEWAEIAPTLR